MAGYSGTPLPDKFFSGTDIPARLAKIAGSELLDQFLSDLWLQVEGVFVVEVNKSPPST